MESNGCFELFLWCREFQNSYFTPCLPLKKSSHPLKLLRPRVERVHCKHKNVRRSILTTCFHRNFLIFKHDINLFRAGHQESLEEPIIIIPTCEFQQVVWLCKCYQIESWSLENNVPAGLGILSPIFCIK